MRMQEPSALPIQSLRLCASVPLWQINIIMRLLRGPGDSLRLESVFTGALALACGEIAKVAADQ